MEDRLRALFRVNPTSWLPLDALYDRFVAEGVVSSDEMINWLVRCASEWDGELKGADRRVRAFAIRCMAAATASRFEDLRSGGVYAKVLSPSPLLSRDHSAKAALLELLKAMAALPSGARFLAEGSRLSETLERCRTKDTVYLTRGAFEFTGVFIWRLNDLGEEELCSRAVSELASPLLDPRWKNKIVITDEENETIGSELSPTLRLLTDLLDQPTRFGYSNMVIRTIDKIDLDWHLWNLFQICRQPKTLCELTTLLLLVRFSKMYVDKRQGDPILEPDIIQLCIAHANLTSALISKRDAESVLSVTAFCFEYVSRVHKHRGVPLEILRDNGLTYEFTNQLLLMSILPTLCARRHKRSEFVDEFIEKLVAIACEHTTRTSYAFRDLVREKNDLCVVVAAVRHAVRLKAHVTKTQAVIIFQSFYYRLQDFVPDVEDVNNYVVVGMDTWDACALTGVILNAIYVYIDEFDIPWHDTVEVLCVYNFCIRIIKTANLDSKLVVQAFKLAQLTIKKFLSPNLALLVDSAEGSVIEEIGRNIYEKLHDPCWDIRDSAMELLLIVTDIAVLKFPAFQQQIADNNLPQLVVTLAVEDSEPYVRASALRCISIMVRIRIIWDNHLKYLDLTEKIISILLNESEGLVRKEAAYVMVNIYEYQKFTASSLDDVLLTMYRAAAEDLHWEVQLAALQFWKKIIANQMSHQGMIDGIFPSVTFSKENRKIVHLDNAEIKKRLKKILNELALRGCLGVLLTCMRDDSDLEVMEEALVIITGIFHLLDKYELNELNTVVDKQLFLSRPALDENFVKNSDSLAKLSDYRNNADVRTEKNCILFEAGQDSDRVIDSIVNSDDMNLLSNVYANRLKVNGERADPGVRPTNEFRNVGRMLIEPEEFIKTVKESNFRKIVDDKRRWAMNITTDINSLFDDILGTFTPSSEVNAMDCY